METDLIFVVVYQQGQCIPDGPPRSLGSFEYPEPEVSRSSRLVPEASLAIITVVLLIPSERSDSASS